MSAICLGIINFFASKNAEQLLVRGLGALALGTVSLLAKKVTEKKC